MINRFSSLCSSWVPEEYGIPGKKEETAGAVKDFLKNARARSAPRRFYDQMTLTMLYEFGLMNSNLLARRSRARPRFVHSHPPVLINAGCPRRLRCTRRLKVLESPWKFLQKIYSTCIRKHLSIDVECRDILRSKYVKIPSVSKVKDVSSRMRPRVRDRWISLVASLDTSFVDDD